MGSSIRFYDRGAIVSEILDKLFKTNFRTEDPNTITFVIVDPSNVVIEKINAYPELYETFKTIAKDNYKVIQLENKSDAEIGFVYTPDEGE